MIAIRVIHCPSKKLITRVGHITTGSGSTMPNVPFTLQKKAFIMSLFGIEASSIPISAPPTPIPPVSVTPTSMQANAQAMMNDVKAAALSRGDNWNYVITVPFQRNIRKLLSLINFTTCILINMMALPTSTSI